MRAPKYSVILAAGKGTRMKSDQIPKVCFEVNGTPAILRAMRSYSQTGVEQFIVVVGGSMAGKVISIVSGEFTNVVYACQPEQNGTAGAVDCALKGFSTISDNDDVLVVAGDRLISKDILEQLYDRHFSSGAEFTLLALELHSPSSAGHIVSDGAGNPMAIVEMADIRQRRTYGRLSEAIERGVTDREQLYEILCESFFPAEAVRDSGKGTRAFGALWGALAGETELSISEIKDMIAAGPRVFSYETTDGMVSFTPEEAELSSLRNNSVYIVKCGVLKSALKTFTRDNAQKEIYLSDILNAVYRKGLKEGRANTAVLKTGDSNKILGFNNPSELLEVEKILSRTPGKSERKRAPGQFLPLSEWLRLFDDAGDVSSGFYRSLCGIYGDDSFVISRQVAEMKRLGEAARRHFSLDTPLMFVRAPGRLNTMGRHVDHQGGNCNLMTISYETMMFVAERDDDLVTLEHVDHEDFPPAQFKIGELLAELPWEDWETLVNSRKLVSRIKEKGVDWTDYIRAAILRIQKKFKAVPLSGMDMLVSGNIPMAAGLSSSSSLIVCATEALVHLNGLETFPNQFITLCGEGEWFVGTHGGSADHAAVKLGGRGSITRVKFFDFGIIGVVPFPEGYSMLVCDSGIKARKSSNAKAQFNQRISCYRIGFELIRKYCPQYSAVLHYLRDVNTANLHVPLREIYKILLMLPENPTRVELEAMLPEADWVQLTGTVERIPELHYPIRGIVMYGLCEMRRSERYADMIVRGDMGEIGRMMAVSHDGDRVVRHDANWNALPYVPQVGNNYIMSLLDDLESGDVERVKRAQLECQSGAYSCSIPEIDLLVDIADRTPGVVGAQLAGAGLGGCMMILSRDEAIPELTANLRKYYYEPSGREERILLCRPVAGAGTVQLTE